MLSPYPGLQNKQQKQLISILSLSLSESDHIMSDFPWFYTRIIPHWCSATGAKTQEGATQPSSATHIQLMLLTNRVLCADPRSFCLWGHDTLPPTHHHHYAIVVIIFRIVCSPSAEPIKRRQIKVSRKLLSPCLTSHQRILPDKEMVIADKYLITIRKS